MFALLSRKTSDLDVISGTPERSGAVVSVIGHCAFVAFVFVIAGARPFAPSPAEAISVDLVPAAELPKPKQEPPQKPDTSFDWSTKHEEAALQAAPPSPAQASAPASTQTPPSPAQSSLARTAPNAPDAAAQSTVAPQRSPAPASQVSAAAPDLSEKYGVMLGLPDSKPAGFDALAIDQADVASNFAAQFHQHLKTCSVLPASINRTDNVKITLRVMFTTDGRLAGPPSVVEASASEKGPLLMQASIKALMACQPYAMLPADKYKEWRVLDLKFTPADFKSG